MTQKPDKPPTLFIVWLSAATMGAGALLALLFAHG